MFSDGCSRGPLGYLHSHPYSGAKPQIRSQALGTSEVMKTPHLARSIPKWWSTCRFTTNEGAVNFFCELRFAVVSQRARIPEGFRL